MKFWTREKKKEKDKDERRKWFLENGSMFLEELIADSNGISNPIRMFSSDQISEAEKLHGPKCFYYDFFTGVMEDRSYTIKKYIWFGGDEFIFVPENYKDIVLSARVSNHSGFLKLIGCCLEVPSVFGVFENPENGVLNNRGSVGCDDSPLLPWNVGLKIAREVATAITYLHTAFPRIIIHRDINPRNVFLDKNWNAKLTGFSVSVTLPEGKTWIKDEVRGTFGYVDPNYITTGLVTEYTDVFSFGILMLVLLMGRPAVFVGSNGVHCNILDYVKDMQERGEPVEFGDDTNDTRSGQMKMFLELALRCCEKRNKDRPKMILVAKALKLIERSLDCNVLEIESLFWLDNGGRDEEEEPLDCNVSDNGGRDEEDEPLYGR